MTDTALVVGDRFTMKDNVKPVEVKDHKGRVAARYLPGLSYRVTGKNAEIVRKMYADGLCVSGGSLRVVPKGGSVSLGTSKAKVAAKVTTTKRTRKKKS